MNKIGITTIKSEIEESILTPVHGTTNTAVYWTTRSTWGESLEKQMKQRESYLLFFSEEPRKNVGEIINKYKELTKDVSFIYNSFYKFDSSFKIWTFLRLDNQKNRFKIYDIEYKLDNLFPEIKFEIIPFHIDNFDEDFIPTGFNKI